jgi:peptidoglycan/LPS O-acetylase OafA/YrhL
MIAAEGQGRTFRPDIEGLRAFAVSVVVVNHLGLPIAPAGFVGVDIFFVISGYLITRMLVAEGIATGKIDLIRFYARRVRRLLPAAALMLIVSLIGSAVIFSPDELAFAARGARSAALYLSNVFFALNAGDYFAAPTKENPFLHTWSLAVEEQFYAVWPMLILIGLALRRSRAWICILLAALTIASFGVSVKTSPGSVNFAYYLLPARAWEFGLGGLTALIPSSRAMLSPVGGNVIGLIGILGLIASVWIIPSSADYPGWIALFPVAATILCLHVGAQAHKSMTSSALGLAPLQWLGRLSYSWYLWHWPLLVLSDAALPGIGTFGHIVVALASLGVAAISFYGVENPIRFNAQLSRRPFSTLAVGLALTILSAGAAATALSMARTWSANPAMVEVTRVLNDVPEVITEDCVSLSRSRAAKQCVYGNDESTVTIVIFGDSHAIVLSGPIREISAKNGWKLVTFLKAGCPATDVNVARRGWGSDFPASCNEWRRNATNRILQIAPSLTLLIDATEYVDQPGTGLKSWTDLTVSQWASGARRTTEALVRAGLQVAIVRDNPRFAVNVPACVGRSYQHNWFDAANCIISRDKALDPKLWPAIVSAVRNLPNVSLIDFTDELCPGISCPVLDHGRLMYMDSNHLSDSYALSLSADLERRLKYVLSQSNRADGAMATRAQSAVTE